MDARLLLYLVADTVEDRRLVVAAVDEPHGVAIDVALPAVSAPGSGRPAVGDRTLLVVLSRDRRTSTPVRFGVFRGLARTGSVATASMVLDGRPLVGNWSLAQSFLEARFGGPSAGRLRIGPPPLPEATDDQATWRETVDRVAAADPSSYEATVFLRLVGADFLKGRITIEARCPGATDSVLREAEIAAYDSDGNELAAAVAGQQVGLAIGLPGVVSRVELRHPTLFGTLNLEGATHAIEAAREEPQRVAEASAPYDSAAAVQPAPELGYEIFSFVRTEAKLPPAATAELARRLAMINPSNRRLKFEEARALVDAGEPQRASEVLEGLPETARTGEIDGLLVVTELLTGRLDGLTFNRFERASFDDAWLFERLLGAVEALPDASRGRITSLFAQVLSDQRAASLVARVGKTLGADPQLAEIANRIADASPTDALALLERAGDVEELPTEALDRLLELRLDHDRKGIGDVALELVRRRCSAGDIDGAISVAERTRAALHWREAEAIAGVIIDIMQREAPTWSDDRTIQAMLVLDLATEAIRGAKDVDLLDAIDMVTRLRAALEPLPGDLAVRLAETDEELFGAFEATEEHRAALEEMSAARLKGLRKAWQGKRVTVVGGRQPVWWDQIQSELALAKTSAWRESEPGRRPSYARLKALVGGGKVDLIVVMIDYIAHSTSEIGKFAKEKGTKSVDSRSGRFSFLQALARAGAK